MPLRRRITWTLFSAQALGSAGFLVASTVTPIVGARLSGRPSWAGVPAAFYWGGGALLAVLWGRLMDPIGRRRTLAVGLAVGVVGAIIAGMAVVAGSFPRFVGGLVLMGGAHAGLQLARFMAGEVHPIEARGRAISTVVMGGTVGAVLGPMLVAPMSAVAESFGRPGLSGPYLASAGFFLAGVALVWTLLRPDPRDLARAIAAATPTVEAPRGARPLGEIARDPGVGTAVVTMMIAQAVMSMLMVITALHMSHNGHPLGNISVVMSAHVLGMFAFSLVSGRLADVHGRRPVIMVGSGLLATAALGAAPSVATPPLAVVLFLLGLGWNLCYVGASALLADRLAPAERGRVQGINDSILTATAAVGSLLSGVVFSEVGYRTMGLVSAAVALIPLALGWRLRAAQAVRHAAS